MEKKVDKRAEQDADALNRNIDQQARHAPTDLPADDGTKRRTWEGYAEDYRGLSEQLVDVSRRQQEALAHIAELDGQLKAKDGDLKRVKAQRLKDLDRLAAVSRTRDLLEKRAAAQMAKVAAAMARPSAPPPPPSPPAVFQRVAVDVPAEDPLEAAADPAPHPSALVEADGFAARLEERPDPQLGWGDRQWWKRTIAAAQKAHKEQRLWDAKLYLEVALLIRQTSSLWEQLGHVLRESGQYLEAEIAYRRALISRPEHAEMLFLSGYCLEMAGATSSAIPFYSAALERDPKLAARYPQLRDFHTRLGQ